MSRTRKTVLVAIAILALLTAFVVALVASWDEAYIEQDLAGSPAADPAAGRSPGRAAPASRATAAASMTEAEAGRAIEALRHSVELARAGGFYLVLDPRAGALTLRYRGAVTRTWPVTRIEAGRRKIMFIGSGHPDPLGGTVWTAGRLQPAIEEERPLLEVDSRGTPQGPEPPLIPPTPEEAVPAPGSYLIRFEEGLTVEVVAGDPGPQAAGPGTKSAVPETKGEASREESRPGLIPQAGHRLRDAWDALMPGAGAHPRLRLVLPPAEAGSLYRSLQDGTALVIG